MANEVQINVTGRDNQATVVLNRASGSADKLRTSVRRAGEVAGGVLTSNVFMGLAKQISQFVSAQVAAGDEIATTAQQMGVSTDALQEMRYWADQNGLAHADLERAVGRLNQRIGRAAEGNQKYSDAFAALDVQITDTNGELRDSESVMRDTIAALREVEDPARRAALAGELFGTRLGRQLQPALDDTSVSLEEATRRAHELGIIMDGEAIEGSARFAAAVDDLKQSSAGLLREGLMPLVRIAADTLIPALTTVVTAFRDLPDPLQAVTGGAGALAAVLLILTPRLIAARTAMMQLGLSARAANRALGLIGAALAAAAAALAVFGARAGEANAETSKLVTDLERFQQTGRVTGEIINILGEDASDLRGRLQALDPTLRENRGLWDSTLDVFRVTHAEHELLKDDLAELDQGLAAFVEAGGDGEEVLRRLALHYGLTDQEMRHVLDALPRYQEELERAGERERDAVEAAEQLPPVLRGLADAYDLTGEKARESAEEIVEAWQTAADDFVDQVEAYKGASEELREDQEVTTETILEELRKQVEAQTNWQTNMVELAGKVPPAIFDELARLGPEGAPLVEQLTKMSSEELDEYIALMQRKGRTAGGALISEVQANFMAGAPALAAIAEQEGEAVAEEIADGMRRNGSTVEQAARNVGLRIDRGVGGNRTIRITPVIAPPVGAANIQGLGGPVTALAAGGPIGAGMQHAQGGGPRGSRVLVGEHRPEVVELPGGARVIPSVDQAMDRGQAAGGGVTINVFVEGSIRSDRELVELIRDEALEGGLRGVLGG